MAREWNQARIQRYIDEGIEESLTIEYKSGEALIKVNGRAKEIAKDVSAMANSAGGVIIYGISEEETGPLRYRPVALSPVNRRECSKETLEQIISSNIQPRISGIKIFTIPLQSDPPHVIYAVSIPQSDTVHQVTSTKRYYKRFNFESVPMEDYEIRDILNRAAHPDLEPRVGYVEVERDEHGFVWSVPIFAKNYSMAVAKDTSITVEFLDATPDNYLRAEKFVVKTQPQPSRYDMYIGGFYEAIHRGLNKYIGTFWVTIQEPQSLQVRIQVFSAGMRAKWWLIKLNFGQRSATVQILDEGYLY